MSPPVSISPIGPIFPHSLQPFEPFLNGKPNTLPIESAHRAEMAKNFFAPNRSTQWRSELLVRAPRLIEDFLRSPRAYPLNPEHWRLLISELGSYARLGGFADRSAALANVLTQRFQQNQDAVLTWVTHYIQALSTHVPRAGPRTRASLMTLTEHLFGIGKPSSARPWNAQTHMGIRTGLSRSVLGIHLAAHQYDTRYPPESMEWLSIDRSALIQNLNKLPAIDELPALLLQKLRVEIARLSTNSDGTEPWWQVVTNSYLSDAPLLPRKTLLAQLFENTSRADTLWIGLLKHCRELSFHEMLRLAPQWHALLSEINTALFSVNAQSILRIFEFLQKPQWPTTCASHKSIQKDFIRLRVAPALLHTSEFQVLPLELLDPLTALLTNTLLPEHKAQVRHASFFVPDDPNFEPSKELIGLAQDFRQTYLTMSPNGQRKHRENLPSFKLLPRYTQSLMLKGLFQQIALARLQNTLTKAQVEAILKLLPAWGAAGLSVNGETARFIAMHIDLTPEARSKKLDGNTLQFWQNILLPALIGDSSNKAEDYWAIVLWRSAFAASLEDDRLQFAQALAEAHQAN